MNINIAIVLVMVVLFGYVTSVIWKQLRQKSDKPVGLTHPPQEKQEKKEDVPEEIQDNIIQFHPARRAWQEREERKSAAGSENKELFPLHEAVHKGDIGMIRNLLQLNYDIEEKDDLGRTPLYIAACDGRTDILEILIQHGASINANNYEGDTPLHCAVMAGTNQAEEAVTTLLEHGAEVNARNNNENTPLRLASFAGDMEVVSILRRYGARF